MSRPVTAGSAHARHQMIKRIAPCYRQASFAQKGLLLDAVVAVTGYTRKYAIGLLNQAPQVMHTIRRPRRPQYGPEVQQALVLAWTVTNRICPKRLIPFLPTLVEALERRGHLQLTEEHRRQRLSVSAATTERWLHAHRSDAPRGLSTTKAGPLLKHQIPIRTFQQWDEAQPGFLEADLVAHGGERL
ncbi:MAG: hypothetical protein J2P37_36415, partial [Ktedonobacteraceae bacterium]|nr:hypothetical protein [Ktedonobacteraceae bacterium]